MKRRLFVQLGILVGASCNSDDAHARATAKDAQATMNRELSMGDPETKIMDFFRRHKWLFEFDNDENRFYAEVFRSDTHLITAYVYVNKAKQFVRSEVQIDILGMP